MDPDIKSREYLTSALIGSDCHSGRSISEETSTEIHCKRAGVGSPISYEHAGKPNDNSPFERVEEFKYLETTLTNQNSISLRN